MTKSKHKFKPVQYVRPTAGQLLKISIGLTPDIAKRVERYAKKNDMAVVRAIRTLLKSHPEL